MPPLASRTQKTLYRLWKSIPTETGLLWDGVGLVIRPPILQHPFYRLPEPDPPADQGGIKLSCRLTLLRISFFYAELLKNLPG
jgi:hypothetical protein